MKITELLEAKARVETPDWVPTLDKKFKDIIDTFGFRLTDRPRRSGEFWTFGGRIVDSTEEQPLPMEKRMIGLQKEVANLLFKLHEAGGGMVEVVIYRVSFYSDFVGQVAVTEKNRIWDGDTLASVQHMVRDRLFINTISTGGYEIKFVFGVKIEEPKPKEPEPKPRFLRVVKKSA